MPRVLMILLAAALCSGQSSLGWFQTWLDEDVRYIISDQETRAFKHLKTDRERSLFIDQFWLRRDPTPDTEENEFEEEHYRRIKYADEQFSSSIPGWRTDRGLVYIKYGPPDEIESVPAANPGDASALPVEQCVIATLTNSALTSSSSLPTRRRTVNTRSRKTRTRTP